MRPFVSVIVPVYRVEKYIEQCARALFEQTLDNMEFIFVDDCTPDSAMEVLSRVMEDYPARVSQVKILHNEVNRGLPYTRHRGVEVASGDYIIHCDSDDWPEPEMYEKMFAKACEDELDMVICSVRRVLPNRTEPLPSVDHTDDLLESLLYLDLNNFVCNKLVARQAYDSSLILPKGNMSEDSALIIQLAANCHSWGFLDEMLYNYRYTSGSISFSDDIMGRVEQIRANVELICSFLDNKGLSKRYKRAMLHFKCWVKTMAFLLPRDYYIHLYPETNLRMIWDRRFTIVERMGHLTQLLGIHGISHIFTRKR